MPAIVHPAARREPVKTLLQSELYASTLVVLTADRYGVEAFDWHPDTLRLEFADDFDVNLSDGNMNRLMAGIAVVTTDRFFKDVDSFIQLCNVLSGSLPSPDVFDPADSAECAWGITEAMLLSPPDDGEQPFSDDIRRYLGVVLEDEGFVTAPDVLGIAIPKPDGNAAAQWENDPAMFSAVYKNKEGKTEEIQRIVRGGLQELVAEIAALPLLNGNAEEFVARAKQALM